MTTLLLAEHDDMDINEATTRALTGARQIGAPVTILVAGYACRGSAEAAARLDGVERVILVEAPHLRAHSAEPLADLIVSLMDRFDAIVAPATTTAKNALPRAAALLDVMQVSDVVAIEGRDKFVRPIYAGNALERLKTSDGRLVLTLRTSAFEPAGSSSVPAPIEVVAAPVDGGQSAFVSRVTVASDRPDLATSRIVVSGGRAFGSKENFHAYLGPLAERLGAAIGASRAAVDHGFAANELQVGQTGRFVAPDIYFACGISGAIQHLAGMKDSKIIVAINKDPEAPIFQVADYGLVGDVFDVLPELTTEL